jgi:hypothetical protein
MGSCNALWRTNFPLPYLYQHLSLRAFYLSYSSWHLYLAFVPTSLLKLARPLFSVRYIVVLVLQGPIIIHDDVGDVSDAVEVNNEYDNCLYTA